MPWFIPFSKLLIFIEKGKKSGVLLPFGKGFDVNTT
jgi:hypothetical protein